MWTKLFFSILLIATYLNTYAVSTKISDELFGIQLGSEYKTLTKNYKFVKVKSVAGADKVYKIVYTESFGIETYLHFFKSKVYKIKLVYGKNFADETDWENIYNQTKLNYGEYLSAVTNTEEKNYTETYTWQDENIKQILEKVSNNNVLETFSVLIVDKKIETEILKISPLQKFWQNIISIF